MKKIAILPTLLTLGNGVCGFAAIAYASKITLDGSLSPDQVNYYFWLSAALGQAIACRSLPGRPLLSVPMAVRRGRSRRGQKVFALWADKCVKSGDVQGTHAGPFSLDRIGGRWPAGRSD